MPSAWGQANLKGERKGLQSSKLFLGLFCLQAVGYRFDMLKF